MEPLILPATEREILIPSDRNLNFHIGNWNDLGGLSSAELTGKFDPYTGTPENVLGK